MATVSQNIYVWGITDKTLPNVCLGSAYTPQTFTLTGVGSGPYTWADISSPPLPTGMSFDTSTQVLSGTPTSITAGGWDHAILQLSVTSSDGQTAYKNFPFIVYTNPIITNDPTVLTDGVYNTSYSDFITSSVGATSGFDSPIPTIVSYSIISGSLPDGLVLNASTGEISGLIASTNGLFSFIARVIDSNGCHGDQALSISITGFELPEITTTSLPDGIILTPYSQTLIGIANAPGSIIWSITSGSLPGGLSLTGSTGEIAGTTDSSEGTSTFIVRATNSNGYYSEQELSITVNIGVVSITTNSLSSSCRRTSYTQSLVASGGTPPYTWSLDSGTLPANLTLDSGGNIGSDIDASVTPGIFSFTVRAVDSAISPIHAIKTLSITVYQEPVWVTTNPMADGHITVPYSQFLNATGAVSYSLESGDLPDNLYLNRATGEISGTPSALGTFDFIITATSGQGCTTDLPLSIWIRHTPHISGTFTNSCDYNSNGVTTYAVQLTGTDGVPPYIFQLYSGPLPQALTVSRDGLVSGVPAESGVFSPVISVIDSEGNVTNESFTFEIYSGPKLFTSYVASAIYGRPYAQIIEYTGGTPPVVMYLSNGSLPPGLVFDSMNQLISGTPTQAGFFAFDITVQDANSCANTKSFSITVLAPPSITTALLPNACQTDNYSAFILVSSGLAPYYWFISSSAQLPQNLVLDPRTGEIAGIPQVSGTFKFSIKVVDQNGLEATADFTLAVIDQLICKGLGGGNPGSGGPGDTSPKYETRSRMISLESTLVVVEDPFHQTNMFKYTPTPFQDKPEN